MDGAVTRSVWCRGARACSDRGCSSGRPKRCGAAVGFRLLLFNWCPSCDRRASPRHGYPWRRGNLGVGCRGGAPSRRERGSPPSRFLRCVVVSVRSRTPHQESPCRGSSRPSRGRCTRPTRTHIELGLHPRVRPLLGVRARSTPLPRSRLLNLSSWHLLSVTNIVGLGSNR